MTARGLRGVEKAVGTVAALAVVLALAASPAWGASGGATTRSQQLDAARLGPARTGTGIVQAVRPHAVVVRQLDGRVLRVPVGGRTAVFVNGVRSSLAAVQPGFVVTFKLRPTGPAVVVRASNTAGDAPSEAKPGTVQSVSADAVVVTGPNGGTATIAAGPRTRVWLNGSPATLADIVSGDRLAKVGGNVSGGRPARVLRFRRQG